MFADGSGQLPTGSTVDGLRRNICTRLRIFSASVKSSDAEPAIENRLRADGEEGISVEELEALSGSFNASKSVFLTFNRRAKEQPSACIATLLGQQGTGVQRTFKAGKSLEEAGGHAAGALTTALVKCFGHW